MQGPVVRLLCATCLLLALRAQAVLVVNGTAFAFDQLDFAEAILDPSATQVLISQNLTLTRDAWPSGAPVELNRSIVISTHNYGVDNYTLDLTSLPGPVATCTSSYCDISVEGAAGLKSLTIISTWPADKANAATPFLGFIDVGVDGTLALQDINLISTQPGSVWDSSNLLYTPNTTMEVSCLSPAELLLNGQLPLGTRPAASGYVQFADVRLALAQAFVCGPNYTAALCTRAQQVCASRVPATPLAADACTQSALAAACSSRQQGGGTSPAAPSQPPGASSSDGMSGWQVGAIVGAVMGTVFMLAAGLLICLLRRRQLAQRRQQQLQLLPLDPGKATGQHHGNGAGARGPAALLPHMHVSACVPDTQETATTYQGTPQSSVNASASRDAQPMQYVSAPASIPLASWVPVHDEYSDSGFSDHQPGDGMQGTMCSSKSVLARMVQLAQPDSSGSRSPVPGSGSRSQVPGSPSGSAAVVIDMAPSMSGSQLQLARNPLGVALHAVLGSGAYGTVYEGTWQGQPAAIKVIKQQVQDMQDLEAILQFREATLGAELQHPRIVRTLAHALVVPEGLVDATGTLARPGTVEAHIVSSLCDRGTLKAWLQRVWHPHVSGTSGVVSGTLAVPLGSPSRLAVATLAHAPSSRSWATEGTPSPNGSLMATTPSAQVALALHEHATQQAAQQQEQAAQQQEQHLQQQQQRLELHAAPRARSGVLAAVLQLHKGPAPWQRGQKLVPQASDNRQGGASVPAGQALGGSSRLSLQGAAVVEAPSSGTGPYSGTSFRSSRSEAPSGVFPPLACMPAWGGSGLPLHAHLQCHLLAVVDCLLEVADGLSYLLSRGVVHGDLKPQNCLLCSDPADTLRGFTVKIGDFGISRVLQGTKSHTTVSQPPGTLAYFAPELLSTCRLSPACDLYSFGIIMYELLTCKQPLGGLSMAQVLYKKATGKVDEHLTYPAEVPPQYVQLARECYSLEASSRPSLAQVLARLSALRHHLTTDWTGPVPPPAPPTLSDISHAPLQ